MNPSAVRSTDSSINKHPILLEVVCLMCMTISRRTDDLPRPEPAVTVMSSVGLKPCVIALSFSHGYVPSASGLSADSLSHRSSGDSTPSGTY